MTFREHRLEIASPVTANPAKALADVLGAVLERGLNLGFFVVLHTDLPVVEVEPPRNEVIVISVQLTCSPSFVGEIMRECILLQDAASVSHGTARKAGESTVNVQTSRAIKVATFEVGGTQETPHAHSLRPSKSLRGTNATSLGVLKGCQHPLKDLCRPHNIIVHEDGDPGLNFWYRPAHLPALVRLPDAQDTNLLGVDFVRQLGEVIDIGVDGDQYQFIRLSLEASLESGLEFIATLGDGRQDDGDILRSVGGILGKRYRPVSPM